MHCSDGRIATDRKFGFGGLVGLTSGPDVLFEGP